MIAFENDKGMGATITNCADIESESIKRLVNLERDAKH